MITDSDFRAPWWLRNRHLQTIVPNTLRPVPAVTVRRERIELPDGDFTDVDWTTGSSGPIVIMLHGLEGSLRSRYASGLLRRIHLMGMRGALLYFRGCSGEPNRLARGYHSGHTQDFDHFLKLLQAREPQTPIAAVGYSLGGNALLKWLGETGPRAALRTAVAVSVPFELDKSSEAIDKGLSRLYQWELMGRMKRSVLRKFRSWPDPPVDLGRVPGLRSFREFDDLLTGPLNGYRDAADYYTRCSSRQFMRHIVTPTLVIHSLDDPFMSPDVVPRAEELGPGVRLELARTGGHVGFTTGRWPWQPRFWLEERISAHFKEYLQPARDTGIVA